MPLLLDIFITFVKLGLIAYGGGPAMIPVMQASIVNQKGWVTDEDFRTALAMGNSLPGPIAPQMAFWTGMQVSGVVAGIVAAVAVVAPSLFLMFLLTIFFWNNIDNNTYLKGAAKGAGIGVVGLLAYVAYDQAYKVFVKGAASNWWEGLRAHPNWVILVAVVFALSLWRPTLMVPVSIIGAAVYGAIFLR